MGRKDLKQEVALGADGKPVPMQGTIERADEKPARNTDDADGAAVSGADEQHRAHHEEMKIVVLGDSGCGKTAAIDHLVLGKTVEPKPTVSGQYLGFEPTIDGVQYPLRIWDTPGPRSFRSITSGFVHGAAGVLLFFDVTDKRTFENIAEWHTLIEKNVSGGGAKRTKRDVPVLLVGGKADGAKKREVSVADAQNVADAHGLAGYVEVNANDRDTVQAALDTLVRAIRDVENGKLEMNVRHPERLKKSSGSSGGSWWLCGWLCGGDKAAEASAADDAASPPYAADTK